MVEIISEARGAKTNANVTLKTPIKNLSLGVNKELKEAIEKSIKDFKATLFVENLDMEIINDGYKVYKTELNLD